MRKGESCGVCIFWHDATWVDAQGLKEEGLCHRFPPAFGGDSWSDSKWPVTSKHDWCGECRPPKKKKAKREIVYGIKK